MDLQVKMCCTPNKLFLGKKDLTAAYLTYSKHFSSVLILIHSTSSSFMKVDNVAPEIHQQRFITLYVFFSVLLLSIPAFVSKDFFCSCFHSIYVYFFNSSVSQWIHFTPGFYNLNACADTKDKSHFSMLLTIQLEFQLCLR